MTGHTEKAKCPGSGLAAVNIRNNPDTVAMLGDCPSCKLSYAVKQDNGIFQHILQEPQINIFESLGDSAIVRAAKAMGTVPIRTHPMTAVVDRAESPYASKAWVGKIQKEQGIHERRISYVEKRLDQAAKEFARIDKPWWKRW